MRFIKLSSVGLSFASFYALLHLVVSGEEVPDPDLNGLHSITTRKEIPYSSSNGLLFLNKSTAFHTVGEDMVYENQFVDKKSRNLFDVYYEKDDVDGVCYETLASGTSASTSVDDPIDRQKNIWDLIAGLDSFKQGALWTTVEGKRKLTRLKYMVLPVWWSNQDTSDPALMMDIGLIQELLVNVTTHYTEMSWSGFLLEWETLAQKKLLQSSQSNPSMGTVNEETKTILAGAGHIQGTHFDGVATIYWKADNVNLANGGGWGTVNGLNQWMTYYANSGLSFAVTRHEVGHNFGHPHHQMMQYDWRLNRNFDKHPLDGFDMMSGGNGYDISDFGAGSKWFWGWIPDTLVAHMQPEGSSLDCPVCQSDGTFMLYAFDDKNISPEFLISNPNTPEANKMGIHIPLSVKGGRLYSYWISYRGNNAAKIGLSVHLVRYSFRGVFGATYDSWNYDVNGDTATRMDSFIEPGECYYIGPSGFTKDIDIASVDQVHPVVCNLEMVEGQRAKVHVEFLDMANLSEGQVSANNRLLIVLLLLAPLQI